MKATFLTAAFLLAFMFAGAQSPRKVDAVKTVLPVKIDGEINEEAWKNASVINNFTQQRPVFGKAENENSKTEAWIIYDDNAVYIAGFCHETSKDSISTELVGRDVIGVNDFVGVMFDTYMDQINGVGFYVTALGEQYDCKYSLNNEDDTWSTVFQTATKITDKGWMFEMRIPYSALRFSKSKVQNWGINFIRRKTKAGQQFSWSPIDPNKFGLMSQNGTFANIQNIKSPIRLSFSPYFSTYVNNNPSGPHKGWNASINGGMDVKYGLSKSFTLDMTLIPDFGQVQSDNQVLNLSPYEVKYTENRPFFTEGTELFNKGNLFYSRRIGGTPINYSHPYSDLNPGDELLENPVETKLVNATKISGRTRKGLGVGFFNAITKPQYATIMRAGNEKIDIETSPWTNYNILVLDQTMKNNSSVTLVNTNVLRAGKDYDANVTAALWDLYDKKVDWNIWGKVANSRLFNKDDKNISGYNYEVNLGKFRGPFNFEIHQYAADAKYYQNDLGYLTNNNYYNNGFTVWYKITKPKSFYNNFYFQMNGTHSQLYKPRKFQYVSLNANANTQLKNLWVVGINGGLKTRQNDFYEPRIEGKVFNAPSYWYSYLWLNTNAAKKYSANVEFDYTRASRYDNNIYSIYLGNQYRFSNKFSIGLNFYTELNRSNVGFGFIRNDSIYFGLRNRTTVENIFTVKYSFNTKMSLNLRVRHYWSKVDYFKFFNLKEDGNLEDANPALGEYNPDNNANFFNVDMIYTWQFAQGSFINIAWKDASSLFNENVNDRYGKNLNNIISTPQQNNFSVKVIYYLDYLTLKKKK